MFQGNTVLCATNHQSLTQQPTDTRDSAVTMLPYVASTKLNGSKNNHSQVHQNLSKATFWTPGISVITPPTKKKSPKVSLIQYCHATSVTTLCTEHWSNNTTRVQMDSDQIDKTEATEVGHI